MPLRLSFIGEKCDIQDFVAFLRLEGDRAIDITEAIVNSVEGLGLSLNDLQGQGYDGPATMSGQKTSVHKQI